MKTLLLLRHAKAEAEAPKGDHDRALTGRGERDAAGIGRQIRTLVGCPDAVVTSDARRAKQTAKIVAAAVGFPGKIAAKGKIYEASPETLLEVVRKLPEKARCVLLVGHNPGFERLAGLLAGEAGGVLPLPTAGLAHLEFDVPSWRDVTAGRGRLRGVHTP